LSSRGARWPPQPAANHGRGGRAAKGKRMRRSEGVLLAVLIGCLAASPAFAQQKKPAAVGFPDGPGKEVLVSKCFQCHSPNMWMDQRQDRHAWESTLYRMVGRGALWTEEEIRQMADYLGNTYGRKQ
jgi:mono/diheme cytochrome c family protein